VTKKVVGVFVRFRAASPVYGVPLISHFAKFDPDAAFAFFDNAVSVNFLLPPCDWCGTARCRKATPCAFF
jgi:hypothetical protein